MNSAQESPLLLDIEEDHSSEVWSKHKKYYYSEKGRLRNQRAVDSKRKGRLLGKIVDKTLKIRELEIELRKLHEEYREKYASEIRR